MTSMDWERWFVLSYLFAIYLLLCLFYAFVLRRAVQEAQKRLEDGTDWGHLSVSVIFPRLFLASSVPLMMVIGTCHLGDLIFVSSSSLGMTVFDTLSISLVSAGTVAFVGTFLALCLAGSTPKKVLPRIYAVLSVPFGMTTWVFLTVIW